MKKLTIIIASAFLLYSCEKKTNTQQTLQKTDSLKVGVSTNSTATLETSKNDASGSDVVMNNSSRKPALNPAHGEPFHRCDISVGAPIDSAPEQNPSVNNATAPMIPVSNAPAQAIGPKPALNPTHGEPHHRCDLQVGAPLT